MRRLALVLALGLTGCGLLEQAGDYPVMSVTDLTTGQTRHVVDVGTGLILLDPTAENPVEARPGESLPAGAPTQPAREVLGDAAVDALTGALGAAGAMSPWLALAIPLLLGAVQSRRKKPTG